MKTHKIITKDVVFANTPTFTSPLDAIEYGKRVNDKRREELNLDLTPVLHRKVVCFHWDFEQLVLQFENNLFLRIYLSNEKINVLVEDKLDIQADRSQTFDLLFSETYSFFWEPSEIAKKYTGKFFENVYLGESHLYLYFREMALLLFCCVEQDVTNNRFFLFWSESE